ncbi:protein kinase domain protein, partial [Metarhizium majus ARSEF 297]
MEEPALRGFKITNSSPAVQAAARKEIDISNHMCTMWTTHIGQEWPWKNQRYVALKITNSSPAVQAAEHKEIDISNHMCSMWTTHPGQEYVRKMLDSFEIKSSGRMHLCLALELLRLKGDHFMLPFEDPTVLYDHVREQEANPAPFKERRGRPVYQSRPDFSPSRKGGVGFVKLTDFGLAVRGDVSAKSHHDIQPLEYNAPEVMLQAGWSYSADIWNLGLVLWELLAEVNILDGKSSGN